MSDWGFLEEQFGAVCTDGAGQPLPGLAIFKHTFDLSDEALVKSTVPHSDPR